jgi:hypothetical protein
VLIPGAECPSEVELVKHVRGWLNLLADGRLESACAQLDAPNSYGIRWTPEMIERIIMEYLGPKAGPGVRVSRVEATPGDGRPSVVEFADGSGYSVEHDVPLNGTYSDLTLQVEFRWRGQALAMVLHDLHVL